MQEFMLTPIGTVKSTRKIPEDDNWDQEQTSILLSSEYTPESLAELDSFSHLEVIFLMNQVKPEKISKDSRHPRNNQSWPKVGIFAQRGKNRPNTLGISRCEILEIKDNEIIVKGLDAIDGSPVLDIKPWVKEFAPRGEVKQPEWMSELMQGYWS